MTELIESWDWSSHHLFMPDLQRVDGGDWVQGKTWGKLCLP